MNTSPVILLDPQNEHQDFETIFDPYILSRFIEKTQCLEYVSTRLANTRSLHFFIPNIAHTLIPDHFSFLNTIYYVYCTDNISIHELKQRYNLPMFVKIFHCQYLLTYLRQATILYFIEQAERCKHEPDEYDLALLAAAEFSDVLKNDLHKHMTQKTRE